MRIAPWQCGNCHFSFKSNFKSKAVVQYSASADDDEKLRLRLGVNLNLPQMVKNISTVEIISQINNSSTLQILTESILSSTVA